MTPELKTNRRPLIAAATMLGIGLGGFVDGIVFHQLLQVHNMLSGADYYPKTSLAPEVVVVNMEINMFWDGLFVSLRQAWKFVLRCLRRRLCGGRAAW